MNWNNLKLMMCPKCKGVIKIDQLLPSEIQMVKCLNGDFKCSYLKFEEIVNSIYKPNKFKSEEDNLSELNNYGHKENSLYFN